MRTRSKIAVVSSVECVGLAATLTNDTNSRVNWLKIPKFLQNDTTFLQVRVNFVPVRTKTKDGSACLARNLKTPKPSRLASNYVMDLIVMRFSRKTKNDVAFACGVTDLY